MMPITSFALWEYVSGPGLYSANHFCFYYDSENNIYLNLDKSIHGPILQLNGSLELIAIDASEKYLNYLNYGYDGYSIAPFIFDTTCEKINFIEGDLITTPLYLDELNNYFERSLKLKGFI